MENIHSQVVYLDSALIRLENILMVVTEMLVPSGELPSLSVDSLYTNAKQTLKKESLLHLLKRFSR